MFKARYRIVRIGLLCYIEKPLFGFWLKTDKNLRVLSLRPPRRYINPKVPALPLNNRLDKLRKLLNT